jgi:glycosyltransferase involved in cell wall biosynthesis
MNKISVIMPCYNRAHDLYRVLDAYDNQEFNSRFELIAIDDASSDNTFDLLVSYKPKNYDLKVFRHQSNMGPAAARNTGISMADSPILIFVGDDILPLRNFVSGHFNAHQKYKNETIAVLGKVVWPPDMPSNNLMRHIDGIGAQQFSYYYMREGHTYDFRHFYTCNISIKRDFLFAETKWFDTDFIYAAFEDAELGYRLSKRGLEIVYQPQILGYHYHYHNSWSFSMRQYKSGIMSYLLIKKHPGAIRVLKPQLKRLLNLILHIPFAQQSYPEFFEEKMWKNAIRLMSYFESYPNKSVDYLFLKVLEYSYYNGFIDAVFEGKFIRPRIRYNHYKLYLRPSIKKFYWSILDEKDKEIILHYGFSDAIG